MLIKPFDREQIRQQFQNAQPYRWFELSPFLAPWFVAQARAQRLFWEQAA